MIGDISMKTNPVDYDVLFESDDICTDTSNSDISISSKIVSIDLNDSGPLYDISYDVGDENNTNTELNSNISNSPQHENITCSQSNISSVMKNTILSSSSYSDNDENILNDTKDINHFDCVTLNVSGASNKLRYKILDEYVCRKAIVTFVV